ncbi:histidine phosphatase family protein [Clostridium sp. C8-1-8]|uniref:histidine phosphatase family protein n=1 Tax=Clostridium sp. C8-1-8 TaxID=2698831 RepID=UPI001368C857|nr:histidine phosphatase family protein [Clostridium sp. C8-1-8]
MSKIYFVRHAEPDYSIKDDRLRPLTEDGLKASIKVSDFLSDKNITKIFSSPYKRSVDTILDFSKKSALEITKIEDFKERKIEDVWIEDFDNFFKTQWQDFNYKLSSGECLNEVQARNIAALHSLLNEYPEDTIVIGTHGTALSTIINYYDKNFDGKEFARIRGIMPFIVYMEFEGTKLVNIKEYLI